jgi:hypothetical protein
LSITHRGSVNRGKYEQSIIRLSLGLGAETYLPIPEGHDLRENAVSAGVSRPALILTCTIDVKDVIFMKRNSIADRLEDYKTALRMWVRDPAVENIIVVENSGYDLAPLKQIAAENSGDRLIEFISCDLQGFPRHLGKGYGEALALQRVVAQSILLRRTGSFLKINGRYYLRNFDRVLRHMPCGVDVYCMLERGMRWSDSRVFGGSDEFLRKYVCKEALFTNDAEGVHFEHCLAKAALRAIADGKTWRLITEVPNIAGYSGTINKRYRNNFLRRILMNCVSWLKWKLIEM